MYKYARALCLTTSLLLALGGTARAQSHTPATHQSHNSVVGPLTNNGDGAVSEATYRNPPSPICSTSSTASNVDTDCEGTAPHNETSIAVDPTNPMHLVGGANDYQLRVTPGGKVYETIFTRAHVSFDGGQTWTSYPINYNPYSATGDPAVSFDANGTVYLSTLGFTFSQGKSPTLTNPDVVVSHSNDGGKTWSLPVRAASGAGVITGPGISNDKPYLTAWGDGNAIVTWTVFNLGHKGSAINSRIFASVTHDAGDTWSEPTETSGSAAFCVGVSSATACDQDQGSVPVVAADGSIYVAFINSSDFTTGRDQYLVVKVDPTTGHRVTGPFRVAQVFDGFTDFPINIDGRQTYQDSEFRTWSVGNIAADPANASHLAVVWSDMRNSTLPAPVDPYSAVTNSDIIVSQSTDGGATWSAPMAIITPGDQFMPWGAYDNLGKLHVGYFDRSYDPANHKYGYTVASETSSGSLNFTTAQLTAELSDPTQGDRWFAHVTVSPSFPLPTTFLGDYSGIAILQGNVAGYWTDMRLNACFAGRCGSAEDAFFGVAP